MNSLVAKGAFILIFISLSACRDQPAEKVYSAEIERSRPAGLFEKTNSQAEDMRGDFGFSFMDGISLNPGNWIKSIYSYFGGEEKKMPQPKPVQQKQAPAQSILSQTYNDAVAAVGDTTTAIGAPTRRASKDLQGDPSIPDEAFFPSPKRGINAAEPESVLKVITDLFK